MNCLVCDKKLCCSKISKETEVQDLHEITFLLCHPMCKKLHEKQHKIKNDILNLEYKIKMKQIELLTVINKISDLI